MGSIFGGFYARPFWWGGDGDGGLRDTWVFVVAEVL